MAKSFAADHQGDYSGRPRVLVPESLKGTFWTLIYLHCYTPDTVGQVLTKYAAPPSIVLGVANRRPSVMP